MCFSIKTAAVERVQSQTIQLSSHDRPARDDILSPLLTEIKDFGNVLFFEYILDLSFIVNKIAC